MPGAFATTPLLDVVRFAPAVLPPVAEPVEMLPAGPVTVPGGALPAPGAGSEPPGTVLTPPGCPGAPVGADRPWPFWAPTAAGPIWTVEPQAARLVSVAATASGRSRRTRRMAEVFAVSAADSSSWRPKYTARPLTSGHLLP